MFSIFFSSLLGPTGTHAHFNWTRTGKASVSGSGPTASASSVGGALAQLPAPLNNQSNENYTFDDKTGAEVTCGGMTYSYALAISLDTTVSTNGNCATCTADAMTAVTVNVAVNINIQLGKNSASLSQGVLDQGMLALASATDSDGNPLNMQDAARQIGFDHFNWLQIIVSDLQLKACLSDLSLPDCDGYETIQQTVPNLPSVDPPLGGWTYEYWDSVCRGTTCPFNNPIQDNRPMYLDEYFDAIVEHDNEGYYQRFFGSPFRPEYLSAYQSGNRLTQLGAAAPSQALGFLFDDAPGTSGVIVPGSVSNQMERIIFITSLVGVNGTCNTLSFSNCTFQIIPGTTFQWIATNGLINYQPLTFTHKHRGIPIINPVDLRGDELADSIISVDQFLMLGNLTPDSLAVLGGSIAKFSASLIPSEAAAYAKAAKPIPSTLMPVTASGLAYSRLTGTFNGVVTIRNVSHQTISGPLQIVFASLPDDVILVNASGSYNQMPYITISLNSVAAGQVASVAVQFTNPSNAIVTSTPVVYSGSFN